MFNQMTDDEFCFREKILKTAKQCLAENYSERPELCVLREKYESRRRRYGLDKAAMDALIYERMHAKPPEKSSDTMKIRYWRTGHHYPVNRHLCMAFARALELNAVESHWLLTSWMDKSADYYEKAPSADDILYWERRKRFNNMVMAYFRFRTSAQKCFSYGAFRHCYYLDALQYVDSEKAAEIWKNNIYSINYDSELKRTVMLLGEIPRKTMLSLTMSATRDLSHTMMPDQNFVFPRQLDYADNGRVSYLLVWVGGSVYREPGASDKIYLIAEGTQYDPFLQLGGGYMARWDHEFHLELNVE